VKDLGHVGGSGQSNRSFLHQLRQAWGRRAQRLRTVLSSLALITDDGEAVALTEGGRTLARLLAGLDRPIPTFAGDTLRWGGAVILRLRCDASNQSTLLAAFQEDGWPTEIDDPLPGGGGVSARDRLHNTVQSLMKRMPPDTIRFALAKGGAAVCWMAEGTGEARSPQIASGRGRVESI
jgi:hypothetical protein